MKEVLAPAAAPVIPETPPTDDYDFIEHLDDGGEDAADLDEPPATPATPAAPAPATPAPSATPASATPAPAAAPAAAPVAAPPPGFVPVGEVVAERQQRQELQRENERLRLAALEAAQPQPPAPPAPEPDIDYLDDPKGYVDQQVRRGLAQLQGAQQETTQVVQQTAQDVAAQRAITGLLSNIQGHESQFQAQHPDYPQALAHLRTERIAELRLMAPTANDAQILQYVQVEELRSAAALIQQGRNPAEVAYQFAQRRGFKAPAPPAANGAAPPAPPDRSAARGLPAGGGQPEGLQSPEDTDNNMPEFSAALSERFGIRRRT